MLGDTAVAVNPTDERYTALIGKKSASRSPASTATRPRNPHPRRRLGQARVRHRRRQGHARARPQRLRHRPAPQPALASASSTRPRTSRSPARPTTASTASTPAKRIVADLEAAGLLVAIKDHTLTPSPSRQRTGAVIEPRLSMQWFLAVNKTPNTGGNSIAANAIAAVARQGHINFTPEMYTKTYFEWMTNIHDWCISRQLWWGHRIPAWHCDACGDITVSRDTADDLQQLRHHRHHARRPTSSTPGSPPACSPSPSSAGPTPTQRRTAHPRPRRLLPHARSSSPASTSSSSGSPA